MIHCPYSLFLNKSLHHIKYPTDFSNRFFSLSIMLSFQTKNMLCMVTNNIYVTLTMYPPVESNAMGDELLLSIFADKETEALTN